jgi:hypothetical protein
MVSLVSTVLTQSQSNQKFSPQLYIDCTFEKPDLICDGIKLFNGTVPEIIILPKGKQQRDFASIKLDPQNGKISLKGLSLDHFKAFSNMTHFWSVNVVFPSVTLRDSLPYTKLISLTVSTANMTSFNSILKDKKLKLEKLSLNFNQLSSFPKGTFDCMPDLNTLELAENKFQSFDAKIFKPLKKLKLIRLNGNFVKNLNLAFFQAIPPSVTLFHFASSGIVKLPAGAFRSLPNITYINLTSNKLKTFIASKLGLGDSIEVIVIDSNQLTELDVKGCKNLKTIEMDNNKLTEIRNNIFNEEIVFKTISFSSNKVKAIEQSFMERQNCLKTFQYSKNPCVQPGPTQDKKMMMENMENCFANFKS